MGSNRTLFVSDATSLLHAALNRYGPDSRIDFPKLMRRARDIEPSSLFIPLVHVFKRAKGPNDKIALVTYLQRHGFEALVHDPSDGEFQGDHRAGVILADIKNRLDEGSFTHLVVAAAHTGLIKLCTDLSGPGLRVSVLLFGRPVTGPFVSSHFLTTDIIFAGRV